MRLALIGLLAAGVFSAGVAVAEPCTSAVDQGAFDVAALKSELMVVALTCDKRDDYNQFVTRFRSDLTREEYALHGWFRRAYGRSAQVQHDNYITNLANVESQAGLQRGTLFCQDHATLFQQVLALNGIDSLVSFANRQQFPQPISVETCSARPQQAVKRTLRTADKR